MAVPSPDDVREVLSLPFVVMYWPAIIGAIVFFITLARGAYRYAIPVILVALAAQAWHAGWLE